MKPETTPAALAKKYELSIVIKAGQEMLMCPPRLATTVKRDGAGPLIKAHKPEIIAWLKTREAEANAAAEVRRAKIAAIPGLAEIRAAQNEVTAWDKEFNRLAESEDGVSVFRTRPQYDFAAMSAKYPQAAAYLKAESLSLKSNYELAAIGDKALEMVIDGEWQAALDYIKVENDKFVERHLWD